VEQDLLVHVRLVGLALSEEQLGGRVPEQVSRLTHGAERDRRCSRELDVVVADDGQLSGDLDPHARHLLEEAQSQQIVGAECGRRAAGAREPHDALAGSAALRDVERRGLEDLQGVGRTSVLLRGLPGPLEPIAHLHRAHRPAHERDPLVALLAQVGHGQRAALDVVDSDAAPARASLPVDEHDRDALAPEHRERRHVDLHRRDQHPPHPLLEQQLEVVRLARNITVAVADEESDGSRPGDALDALGDVGEERVRGVEHQVGDRAALAGAELSPGLVADETELGDGPQHAFPRRLGHQVRAVEDVRDRSDRHAGESGHVLDAGRACPHRRAPRDGTVPLKGFNPPPTAV